MLAVSLDAPLGWLDDIYKNNSGNENNKLYRLYRNRTKIMKKKVSRGSSQNIMTALIWPSAIDSSYNNRAKRNGISERE